MALFRKKQEETPALPAVDGFALLDEKIGKDEITKASATLRKYKEGKANLEQRIIDNEQWYKIRHWECMRDKENEVQPSSAWLFNSIANKHADAMDNYPEANILPREQGDVGEAKMLSSIIPVILEQNDFEQTYSDVWMYKLKSGTGVYGVFWDSSKLNGLGDIAVKKIDLINLFWEPGITDIQKSKNLFHIEVVDNDTLIEAYPSLKGHISSATLDVAKYIYDDTVDTTNKSVVVDWYYHKNTEGKSVLHYCKYCNDVVLFATENNPDYAVRGWYDHCMYPFIFDPLYQVEGTPAGFGYIDIGKDAQAYIDRGGQAVMQNMLSNTKPRYFIRNDGSVNEKEYADMTNDFVHTDGALGQDSIIPIQGKPLNSVYVSVLKDKIDELKETTGNRDISTGGTASGVTAASAIAAMQEAGSKLSRDNSKAAYRAYRRLVIMIIELIRQFYDTPRQFRILGEQGMNDYVMYSNANIQPQSNPMSFGFDSGVRLPLFDVQVSAQKQSPYSKMAQNELALQFYGAGFFNPQMADQALACLDMMDFDHKDLIMRKIAQNGTMYQQLMMLQQQAMALGQMVDQAHGTTEVTDGLMQQFGVPQMPENNDVDTNIDNGESDVTRKARQRVADSTVPR